MSTPANPATAYSNAQINVATLKELYSDDAWVMRDLIFNRNPALHSWIKMSLKQVWAVNTSLSHV